MGLFSLPPSTRCPVIVRCTTQCPQSSTIVTSCRKRRVLWRGRRDWFSSRRPKLPHYIRRLIIFPPLSSFPVLRLATLCDQFTPGRPQRRVLQGQGFYFHPLTNRQRMHGPGAERTPLSKLETTTLHGN